MYTMLCKLLTGSGKAHLPNNSNVC